MSPDSNILRENIPAQELQRAIQDLQVTRPARAFVKLGILAAILIPLGILFFTTTNAFILVVSGVVFSVFYTALAITTHDAIHHTFSGIRWFDELIPRLISIPAMWGHGLYSEVHKIHHKMNATNPDDPERCHYTEEELQKLGSFGRFFWRHQILLNIFVLGGFGFIYKNTRSGIRFYKKSAGVRRQFWLDTAIVVIGNVALFSTFSAFGLGWRYLGLFLFLERVLGAFMQFRSQIEHYGLWGKHGHFFETQIFGCRNILTNRFVSWFFNGLNYHSMHHAFPLIPFYHLKEAHERCVKLYGGTKKPMVEEQGYLKTMLRLIRTPFFIKKTAA